MTAPIVRGAREVWLQARAEDSSDGALHRLGVQLGRPSPEHKRGDDAQPDPQAHQVERV